jgi:1A family penicillin-binding protein
MIADAGRLFLHGSWLSLITKFAAAAALVALLFASALLWALYASPELLRSDRREPSLVMAAVDGSPLGRAGPLSKQARLRDFPDLLVKAVLSIEDRRFYSHWGIDPRGIARAIRANWTAGSVTQGGSTISQQLAKLQLGSSERSLVQKLRESLTAIWLEGRLGKEEILTRYLNSVYLGSGVYGMSAASRAYFDKAPAKLTLAEAALLAGVIQAPSKFDPARNLEAARQRASAVLNAMVATGAISRREAEAARSDPARLRMNARTAPAKSWFADWIAASEVQTLPGFAELVSNAGRAEPFTLEIRTTLDPKLQELAEQTVGSALGHGGREAALVAMRPDGAVMAMVGGRDYRKSQFNRATDAKRQPGSAFKLFVYYAALRNGFAPSDVIDASPVEVGGWRPKNFSSRDYGALTLTDSFAQSVNSAAVRLSQQVGLPAVIKAARDLGLDADLQPVPSLALGTSEVSLLDLTGAFASVLAGTKVQPWGIAAFGGDSQRLLSVGPVAEGILDRQREMIDLLRAVVDGGTGREASVDGLSVAGKTGTSQDFRDAWFVGFTDSLVVGVWVGNDDNTPMERVTGGALPAQIWRSFVAAATPLMARSGQTVAAGASILANPAPDTAEGLSSFQATAAGISCDVQACSSAYASFRATDCTYQPYDGPRRYCERSGRQPAKVTSQSRRKKYRSPEQPELDEEDYSAFEEGYPDEYAPPPWDQSDNY